MLTDDHIRDALALGTHIVHICSIGVRPLCSEVIRAGPQATLRLPKVQAFELRVPILKEQFLLPDGTIAMLTDNDIRDALAL